MKKQQLVNLVNIMMLAIAMVTMSQCQKSIDNAELQYPIATKYAIILRATKAELEGNKVLPMVAHCRINGDAKLKWNVEIEQGDKFDLILNYSVLESGANIDISSAKQIVTHNLEITEGRAIKFPFNWRLNMERKLVGQIDMKKGLNKLSLALKVPDEQFETNIYTLELVPVSKKKSIAEDLKRLETIRPDMGWFSNLNYGAMFHWTSETMPREGEAKPYQDAVKDFDVDAFVNMVEKMGVNYIIFTGCHAQPHFPAPLEQWEKEYQGMTTQRDLIAEIADACHQKDIKFILYLSTHVYAKLKKADLKEFERLNFELISEVGNHYKEKIDGYWFDGWYQCNEKFPEFNYEKFYEICKVGNPNRVMCLNTWLYPISTPWQDYWAGEIYTEGVPQSQSVCQTGPAKGLQFHHLVVLQTAEGWVHTKKNAEMASPSYTLEELINYISSCKGIGPITLNMGIYQDGTVGKETLTLMSKVKSHFDK